MKSRASLQRLFRAIVVLAPLGAFLLVATAAEPASPKLAAMIKQAAQEGEIVYQGPDPITRDQVHGIRKEFPEDQAGALPPLWLPICVWDPSGRTMPGR